MAEIEYSVPQAVPADADLQAFLDQAADMGEKRKNDFALYEHYYEVGGKVRLNDRQRRYLEASGLPYSENFCEPIIDTMAERLSVVGYNVDFTGEGQDPTEQDVQASATLSSWLGDVWQRNRMDAVQADVHLETLIKSESFLFVDWDETRQLPRFVFNRPDICKACYNPSRPDVLDYVSKTWTTQEKSPTNPLGRRIQRLNLYFPDRIEKWYRVQAGGAGGWEHHVDEGDSVWPLSWVDGKRQPLGIPVVHFRNKPRGRARGRSELRGVIPQIDLLNKQCIDVAGILDNQAWRQRYAAGIDGDGSQFKNVPGDVWTTTNKDAKFGDFAADDAAGALAAVDQTLSRIARRSRTPLHLLTGGDMPSGEALKSSEAGLIAKVKDRQVSWGNGWEDAQLIGLRLTAAFGTLPVKVNDLNKVVITAEWSDPESRNEKDEADTALVYKELGVSQDTLLTRLGFDPQHEKEQRELEGSGADETLAKLLDRGAGLGGTAVPPSDTTALQTGGVA